MNVPETPETPVPDDNGGTGDSELRKAVDMLAKSQQQQQRQMKQFMDDVMKTIAATSREPRAPDARASFVPEGTGSRDAGDASTRARGPTHPTRAEASPFVTDVSSGVQRPSGGGFWNSAS